MLVLPPRTIPHLAARIEHAYLRRRPHLDREYDCSRVWSAAAGLLVALHQSDPTLPLDPEFYVACLLRDRSRPADPWRELVHPGAAECYRRRIRGLVRALRDELRRELRLIRRRVRAGYPLEEVLTTPSARISPLARFIAAYRRLGPEAAGLHREAVRRQHQACPLYRHACEPLLPPGAYPVLEIVAGLDPALPISPAFSLN